LTGSRRNCRGRHSTRRKRRNNSRRWALVDRNGDGFVDDEQGRTASFTVLTSAGNSVRQRSVALITAHLRKIGLNMEWELLDVASLGPALGRGRLRRGLFRDRIRRL
jgi:hypothetical protein